MDTHHFPPSCLETQEKAQKVLRLGIALLTVAVVICIILVICYVAYNQESSLLGYIDPKHRIKLAKRGKWTQSHVMSAGELVWSPKRQFFLGLLPDLTIINASETDDRERGDLRARVHFFLGFNREVLGSHPTLHFDRDTGLLELKNSKKYIVWTSESGSSSAFTSMKNSTETFRYQLELTDAGILQVIGISAWEENKRITVWSSTKKYEEPDGYRPLRSLHLFPSEQPLHSLNDAYHLVFNDLVGMLQLWQSSEKKCIWQSEIILAGEPPWFCVLTPLGFLTILDRSSTPIWTSTYLSRTKEGEVSFRKSLLSPSVLKLSNQGRIELCEESSDPDPDSADEPKKPYWIGEAKMECPPELIQGASEIKKTVDGRLPLTPIQVNEWFSEKGGYRRVMDRLLLLGNDVLVSHQRLKSLTDDSYLELEPRISDRTLIHSYLMLDNSKATVYYVLLWQPISLFTENLHNLHSDLAVTSQILCNPSYHVLDEDRPLALFLRGSSICLTSHHGKLIAKRSLHTLTDYLNMHA